MTDVALRALRTLQMRPADSDLRSLYSTMTPFEGKTKVLYELPRNRARRIGRYLTGAFLTVAGGKAERLRCFSGSSSILCVLSCCSATFSACRCSVAHSLSGSPASPNHSGPPQCPRFLSPNLNRVLPF